MSTQAIASQSNARVCFHDSPYEVGHCLIITHRNSVV
jgi:hypothetical protein